MVAFEVPETLLRSTAALLAWLATYAVHSTILLAAVLLVARWVSSARRREWLWKLGLVGGLVTATWASATSGGWSWQLGTMAPAGPATLATGEMGQIEEPGERSSAAWLGSRPVAEMRVPSVDRRTAPPVPAPSGASATAPPPSARIDARADRGASASTASSADRGGWAAGLLFAWAALALGSLLFTLARHRRWLRGLARHVRGGGPLRRSLDAWSVVWAPAERVRISITPGLAAPVALGAREICVPARAETELTAGEMRAMLGHELAHVRRCDPAWLWLAHSLERFFFFQPLHRLVRHRLQDDMELLSDDWTRKHHEPMELAKCLTRIAQWIGSPDECRERGIAPAMASRDSALVQRVERLLETKPERRSLAGGAALVGAMCVLSALAVARPHVAFTQDAPREGASKAEATDGPALIDRIPLLSHMLSESAAQDALPETNSASQPEVPEASPVAQIPLLSHLFSESAAQDALPETNSASQPEVSEASPVAQIPLLSHLFSESAAQDALPEANSASQPEVSEASPVPQLPLLSHLFSESTAQDALPEADSALQPEVSEAAPVPLFSQLFAERAAQDAAPESQPVTPEASPDPAAAGEPSGLAALLANVQRDYALPPADAPAAQPGEAQRNDASRERLESSIQRYLLNQERARGGPAEDDGQHRLRIGDRLRVVDLYRPNATDLVVTVEAEGDVVLPELGVVRLVGLTREQVKKLLQARYSDYFAQTHIDVQVLPRASSYYVYGEVEQAGRYGLEGSCNVMQAVLYAVPRASSADLQRVQLLRGGESTQRVTIDVARALRDSRVSTPALSARDIVFVPAKNAGEPRSDARSERDPADRHGDGFVDSHANDAPNDVLGVGGGDADVADRYLGAVQAGDGPAQVTLEDYDGDGFVDMLAADAPNDVLGIGGGDAKATERALDAVDAGGGSAQLTFEDYDGDGIPDVYVSNDVEGEARDGQVTRLNTGRGTLDKLSADGSQTRAGAQHHRYGQVEDDGRHVREGADEREAVDRYDPYADTADQPVDAPDVREGDGEGDSGLYEAADDFLGRSAGAADRGAAERSEAYADSYELSDQPAADEFLDRARGAYGAAESDDVLGGFLDSEDGADEGAEAADESGPARVEVRVAADGRVWMNGMPVFDPKRASRTLPRAIRNYLSSYSHYEEPFDLTVHVALDTPDEVADAVLGITRTHPTNEVSVYTWKDAGAAVELTVRVVADGHRVDPKSGKPWIGKGPFTFDETRQLAYEIQLPGEPSPQALLPKSETLRDELCSRLRSVPGQIVEIDARAGVVYDDVRNLTRILCEHGFAVVFVGSKQ